MRLSQLQEMIRDFERQRSWDKFRESLIYAHLIEEITEIGRFILEREGYKRPGLGHSLHHDDIGSEFAQVLTLLVQLANRFGIDLEEALKNEIPKMERRFPPDLWRKSLGAGGGG
jgi:NTP pyrophosphatase (non-canonical NTP hydrolase)